MNLEPQLAYNGEEAVQKIVQDYQKGIVYKLVLMDLNMPFMDGYEATIKIKELIKAGELPEMYVVALSANDSEADKERCREVGMVDHVSKPEPKFKEILRKFLMEEDSDEIKVD
eukprot:CAMPEP_0114575480 /NCGR_PEP_ID=MMETSP0125-20121206/345_1 /TAXON_ID=485358 ORGANISM="Aristerostoma sp., Strain ATCC 50986" /NCGR_SAMPLE_ID=MMETSP0125 /ASSEMBLY_ACC=CAM_ASM_000245 /LENGTH=113 /DNA_ID=CAMNT_0001763243 /DNA_START=338 /DNA_END=679 /DNA_ORIENTATION=+